jgi:hypothetical protein
MATIVSAFNDHFMDFVTDIESVFPDDTDILMAKNQFIAARKANPKLIVKSWKTYIGEVYPAEIEAGEIQFFINKDYSSDLTSIQARNSNKIVEGIERLRGPISKMSTANQEKTMGYIQNLTKLANMV